MKALRTLGLALAMFAVAGIANADVKSGLDVGASVGAFTVVKVTGNPNDDVEEGAKLCYRCKLGNRPQVAVFARKSDERLVELVKQLDKVVVQNADKKIGSFVNLLGEDEAALKSQAKELVNASKTSNVAVVIPVEHKSGPRGFDINDDAEITVLIYKDGRVAANHAYAPGQLSAEAIAKIVNDTGKVLR